MSMKFLLLMKIKILKKIKEFICFKLSGIVFILLINVKIPKSVGIQLTFTRVVNLGTTTKLC